MGNSSKRRDDKPYVLPKEIEAWYVERIARAKDFRIPKKEIRRA